MIFFTRLCCRRLQSCHATSRENVVWKQAPESKVGKMTCTFGYKTITFMLISVTSNLHSSDGITMFYKIVFNASRHQHKLYYLYVLLNDWYLSLLAFIHRLFLSVYSQNLRKIIAKLSKLLYLERKLMHYTIYMN